MGDSSFRRLLLDMVTAVVTTRPPSTSSLVELLRVANPSLLSGSSSAAEAAVRDDAPGRLKLYRALQSKIHPDRHAGDEKERATRLFQDVSLYYERCVAIAESERDSEDLGAEGTHRDNDAVDAPAGGRSGGGDDRGRSSLPNWHLPWEGWWWLRPPPASADGAHSDYVNSDDNPQPSSPSRHRGRDGLPFPRRRRSPGGGGCDGLVGKFACLCVVGLVAYLWFGDGDFDWDWDWETARREYFPSWDIGGGP